MDFNRYDADIYRSLSRESQSAENITNTILFKEFITYLNGSILSTYQLGCLPKAPQIFLANINISKSSGGICKL